MSEILVYNNWDPLEEIWLGDVWPEHFYDDLAPEIRDSFYQITEWTKHDLNAIQKKLEEFNVVVKRPVITDDKSLYLDPDTNSKLVKPPITPRDGNAVVGNKLFFSDYYLRHCYEPLLKEYSQSDIIRYKFISGAGTVKLGRDIILDSHVDTENIENIYQEFFERRHVFDLLKDDYRIHHATNGGHTDGCFMPLKEGLLLTTEYWKDYDLMFPGWKTINLSKPTYDGFHAFNGQNNERWRLQDTTHSPHFNKYIEEYCPEWIGNYKETYFEVNVVMIDEKNMLCIGEHDILFKELEQHGITCHVVPFRPRTFWDGGLHCITLDIRRKATIKDYFPDRGGNGIASVLTEHFNNDTNPFMTGYNNWKISKGLK